MKTLILLFLILVGLTSFAFGWGEWGEYGYHSRWNNSTGLRYVYPSYGYGGCCDCYNYNPYNYGYLRYYTPTLHFDSIREIERSIQTDYQPRYKYRNGYRTYRNYYRNYR